MKNAILTLGLFFITSLSFASLDKEMVKEQEDFRSACVQVTLSCGVSGEACVADMDMLIRHIGFAEAYWCE